jgi:predicted TIM-barrel fold metal-dependent hydrolase
MGENAGLSYRVFDSDNHYYEAEDAFTRHLDPRLGSRTVQWVEVDGRRYHAVGGNICRVVSNPTFDPIVKPGALYDYFRGNEAGKRPDEYMADREPIRPEYRDRDVRLKVMDEQGLEAVWLFPTLGVLYEEQLKQDPWAVGATFKAFNRWVAEDWGLDYQDRIFAGPYISLADLDIAIGELEWAVSNGARMVCMRAAAPTTETGQRSPIDPMFDPFWARLNESGVTLVVHAGDSGQSMNGYASEKWRGDGSFGEDGGKPSIKSFVVERATSDFLATLLFGKLFDRYPNIRMASVENGSSFVPDLIKKLTSTGKKHASYFSEDPADTFRRHVWINPFWEDEVHEVIDAVGVDRVIFGSDWPHMEGLAQPLDYLRDVSGLSPADQQKVMHDNVAYLNKPVGSG